MKLYLDTSTEVCEIKLTPEKKPARAYSWRAGHNLAEGLLKFLHDKLLENGADWEDLTEITFRRGPGSYTGLRIGAAIVNTLASELQIPLYDQDGNQHDIIIPLYQPKNAKKS